MTSTIRDPSRPWARVRRWLGFERPVVAWTAVAALVVGVLIRVTWNALRPKLGNYGEVVSVAIALVDGRGFADAWQVGQGPTAHLMPTMPLLVGGVYALFGVRTLPGEIVLATWSIGLTMVRYVLFNHLFARLGVGERPRLAAFALLCLLPIYISQEAVDFRVWEGGLASFLLVVLLLVIVGGERAGAARVVTAAIVAAALFFVNPMVGLAGYAALALFWWRQLGWGGTVRAAAIAAVPLAALLLPWTLRNAAVMGSPVVLRSNAGLEMALAMNPAMLTSTDPLTTYGTRLAIHPSDPRIFVRMRAMGGEVAYSRWLGEQTRHWMAAHPREAAELAAMHLRQALLPQSWMFGVFSNAIFAKERALINSLVDLAGAAALAWQSLRGRRAWHYPAIAALVFLLPFAFFQPIPRYICVIYPLFAFAAAGQIASLGRQWRNRT